MIMKNSKPLGLLHRGVLSFLLHIFALLFGLFNVDTDKLNLDCMLRVMANDHTAVMQKLQLKDRSRRV